MSSRVAKSQGITAGPWYSNFSGKYPEILANDRTHIARIITGDLPKREHAANMRLIAAAPSLLAALRAFLVLDWNKPQTAIEFNKNLARQGWLAIAETEGRDE